MRVFRCTESDFERVTAFYAKVTAYLEAHVNYPKWTCGVYPGPESVRAGIDAGSQYACEENGEIIGAFVMDDDPRGAYERGEWKVPLSEGEFYVLHTFATDPTLYRKGIGREMLGQCIALAKERGIKALRLDTVPANAPARRLYENMGFSFAGEKDLLRNLDGLPSFALYELNF